MAQGMLSKSTILAACAFAASALAQQTAGVTIEASHGGAGSGLTNTTISVPLNTTYTNAALGEVSVLYLTSASGVPLDSITCTPHLYANGTGMAGLAFTSSSPADLSTNTVQVGSITCMSTSSGDSNSSVSSSMASGTTLPIPTIQNGTALLTTATTSASVTKTAGDTVSTVSDATSTFLTTVPAASSGGTSQQSTVTSVLTATDGGSSPTSAGTTVDSVSTQPASSTSSASASLSSDSAARKLSLAEIVWPGLAVGALGLAMAV